MSGYKAWTFKTGGYPTALEQTTLNAPELVSLSQLLVQIKAAALNPVDVQVMNLPVWSLPYLSSKTKGVGADFSGTVLKVGADLTERFNVGDEVFGINFPPGGPAGTLAEVMVLDTKSSAVIKKPNNWSWEQAAALPLVWLTAKTCIEHVEPYVNNGKNKTVAILGGSSGTGMYNVHLAKQRGWRVIASCSDRNADFVKGMGADEIIDYTTTSVPERLRSVKPDAIIDSVGGTECLGIAKRYVTIVGDKTSRMSMGGSMIYWWNPQMFLRWALGRIGWGEVYDCIELHVKSELLNEALSLPTDKIIIDNTFSFDQVKEAYERLNTGRAKGKVVVKVE